MRIEHVYPIVESDDFARRFQMRAGGLMWLLGAGASASSGIPTAGEMLWEFKQALYVSQRKVSPKSVEDLTNPAVRSLIQNYISSSGTFPVEGAPDEYAAIFEAAWPSEADRRTYIESRTRGAKPSYGHLALATLLMAEHSKIIWTTNFDDLVDDACAKVFGTTSALTTAGLQAPELARETISGQRWPAQIKLHGDFRFRRLKNTPEELRHQDAQLRHVLIEACQTSGMVVAGYSGRDESVMSTLTEAVKQGSSFPGGLFWLHRGDYPPLPAVISLLTRAAESGIDGGLVTIENFDETTRDLVRLLKGIDTTTLDAVAGERRRWTATPAPAGKKGWPVIRLNALPISVLPSTCRRIVCNIEGHAAVRTAVAAAEVDVLCTRTRAGVLAFGADTDLRAAFEPFGITDFALHPIEPQRLRNETGERGLLRDALSRALAREGGLTIDHRRTTDLLAPSDPKSSEWEELRSIVGKLSGVVEKFPELIWREGVGLRIDWADERPWLLVEPRIVFSGLSDENRFAATDFARERTVKRYNGPLNALVGFWAARLAKGGVPQRALGVSAGVEAVFQLSDATAFSRRIGP
ncbi:SIR2 family protein [Mesorhizobium sp. M0923]|uniref:SIR2 family protein n=1 Tax=Mesorhizobium sp. M0923 TaxID=2957028 RepID=UPI0033394545